MAGKARYFFAKQQRSTLQTVHERRLLITELRLFYRRLSKRIDISNFTNDYAILTYNDEVPFDIRVLVHLNVSFKITQKFR